MTVKHMAHYKKTFYSTVSSGTSQNVIVLNAPGFNVDLPTSFSYTYLGVEIHLNVITIGPSTTQNSVLQGIVKCGWTGSAWSTANASTVHVQGIITGLGTATFSNGSSLTSNISVPINYTTPGGQMDLACFADVYTVYSS